VRSPRSNQNKLLKEIGLYVDSALVSDLAPIFGHLSHSEKLSEIKPPLASSYEQKDSVVKLKKVIIK
jgi:hypothetical protein